YTQAQAADHGLTAATVLGVGLDLGRYPAAVGPAAPRLVWAGRVSPEKQLAHAVAAAERLQLPLDICGAVDDPEELDAALRAQPGAQVSVHGLLDTGALAAVLGRARALVMTPRWQEAFGIVAAEALACGTPVVAYARGGVAEVVDDGVTGHL